MASRRAGPRAAAVEALKSPGYHARRWHQTGELRRRLAQALRGLLDLLPASLNFVLGHLPDDGPDAAAVVERCRRAGLFIRDLFATSARMGRRALQIAVKDGPTNGRIATILEGACKLS